MGLSSGIMFLVAGLLAVQYSDWFDGFVARCASLAAGFQASGPGQLQDLCLDGLLSLEHSETMNNFGTRLRDLLPPSFKPEGLLRHHL